MNKPLHIASILLCLLHAIGLSNRLGAGIVISEFMAANRTTLQDEDGDFEDWIELHLSAGNEATVSLGGLYLTDDPENLTKWALPNVGLEPGEFRIVFASNKNRAEPEAEWHTNFRLAAGGEVLVLTDGAEVIDGWSEPYPIQVPDTSFNDSDGFMGRPTPGSPNDTSLGKPVEPVTFSQSSQVFNGTLTVELMSETPDVEILYAINGLRPSLFNSARYEGPIEIAESTFITAVAKKAGQPDSPLTIASYVHLDADLAEFESNLPLVILDSHGSGPPATNDYQRFSLTVRESDSGMTTILGETVVSENSQLRIRGQSSAGFAKKQYRLEILDSHEEERAIPLLGLPRESDWVLGAPYADEALIRNALVYELGREIGIAAPRTAYCEVFLKTGDGSLSMSDYQGVYVLTEAIEVANNRLDLARLTPADTSEDRISGGYIIRHEAGVSEAPRIQGNWQHLEIMEPQEISEAQITWISSYVNAFDQVLRSEQVRDPAEGYAKYIDVDSFIHSLIINEFAREQDAYVRSAYWHKDRYGKLVSGPLWDYNLSFGVSCCFDSHAIEDWQYEHTYNRRGEESSRDLFDWNAPLLADPDFWQGLKDRYFELRQTILNADQFAARVDRHASLVGNQGAIESPAHRNHDRWNTLGRQTTGFQSSLYDFREEPFRALTDRPGIIYDTWEQHIDHIKIWADLRLQWMDEDWIHPRPPKIDPAPGAFQEAIEILQRPASIFNKGSVYFTLDGTDPRAPGGEPAEGALTENPTRLISSGTLTSRFRLSLEGDWSPTLVGRYRVGEVIPSADNLVLTEIMYHPEDPSEAELMALPEVTDEDFEYLEIANVSDQTVDLIGLTFEGEIEVSLARAGTLSLAPGAAAVLVRNEEAFRLRYGESARMLATFPENRLNNAGGAIRLRGFDADLIFELRYADSGEWPEAADGTGQALTLIEIRGGLDLEDASHWKAESPSPGAVNDTETEGERLDPIDFTVDRSTGQLSLRAVPQSRYQLERSMDLQHWSPEGEEVLANDKSDTTVSFEIDTAEAKSAFYRVLRK